MKNFSWNESMIEELKYYCYNFSKLNFRDWISGDKNRTLATMEVSKLLREFMHYAKERIKASMNGEDISKKLEDYSRPKMLLISGHDSTISTWEMFFAKIFADNNATAFYRYPFFATQIALEIYIDKNADKTVYSNYKIRYFFNDEQVPELDMSFEDFVNRITNELWSDERIDEYCGFVNNSEIEELTKKLKEAETARDSAEEAKSAAEKERDSAQAARDSAEAAKVSAEEKYNSLVEEDNNIKDDKQLYLILMIIFCCLTGLFLIAIIGECSNRTFNLVY
jgi:hypothetical protein